MDSEKQLRKREKMEENSQKITAAEVMELPRAWEPLDSS